MANKTNAEKIKGFQKEIRKLNERISEMEYEMGYIESGIYSYQDCIKELKDKIKKLKNK